MVKKVPLLAQLEQSPSDELLRDVVAQIQEMHPADPDVASELAMVLARSGNVLSLNHPLVADVASTGGPTSLSTLLCPLLLRASGAIVPKLGVPGRPAGGIDCLAQVPGFRIEFSAVELAGLLRESGYVHFMAKGDSAPLDGRMFKIRQSMGAQAVPTLVAASLLSKKIAVNVRFAGLDIRVATHGNFGTSWEEARRNAVLFFRAATNLNIAAAPVLTDGRYPYQPYLGRSESLLALADIFEGSASSWLLEHVDLCRILAQACMPPPARSAVARVTTEQLERVFRDNLLAQGTSYGAFKALVAETRARHTATINATKDGFCSYPLSEIRTALVECQNKCPTGGVFPDPVGLLLLRRPGEWVQAGTRLATVRVDQLMPKPIVRQLERLLGTPSLTPAGKAFEATHG